MYYKGKENLLKLQMALELRNLGLSTPDDVKRAKDM